MPPRRRILGPGRLWSVQSVPQRNPWPESSPGYGFVVAVAVGAAVAAVAALVFFALVKRMFQSPVSLSHRPLPRN